MLKSLAKEIESKTGINIFSCYQCGKCSAGCAFVPFMDTPPHALIRLLQLDLDEKALSCNTIWRCGACITCSVRCPRQIDILRIINTVRSIAIKKKMIFKERETRIFDEIFLDNIINNDRLDEFSSVVNFNIKSGKIFKDISLFPILVKKGKLFGGEKVNTKRIAKILSKIKD